MDQGRLFAGANRNGFKWDGGATIDNVGKKVEATIGEANYLNMWWLQKALQASLSVARVRFPHGSATGFLVGPNVFMTNNHVFENEEDARNAKLQFNFQWSNEDHLTEPDEWMCDPNDMFKTNADLDYSIVRVKKKNGKDAGEVWGFLNLRHGASVTVDASRVNIIQHPNGQPKQIAFRDNQVKFVGDTYIQYITDTEYGSSGSPVFDDYFNTIALHSQRVPDPQFPTRWYRNQGTLVDAILKDAGNLMP